MNGTVRSRSGVPIRLTNERWEHIVEEHDDLIERRAEVLGTVEQADLVVGGKDGELLAVRFLEAGQALIVVYRERSSEDGFVITAFIASRLGRYKRRTITWPPNN